MAGFRRAGHICSTTHIIFRLVVCVHQLMCLFIKYLMEAHTKGLQPLQTVIIL